MEGGKGKQGQPCRPDPLLDLTRACMHVYPLGYVYNDVSWSYVLSKFGLLLYGQCGELVL